MTIVAVETIALEKPVLPDIGFVQVVLRAVTKDMCIRPPGQLVFRFEEDVFKVAVFKVAGTRSVPATLWPGTGLPQKAGFFKEPGC